MANGIFCFLLVLIYLFVNSSYGQNRGCRDSIPSNFCNIYKTNKLCDTRSSNVRSYVQRNCRRTCKVCTDRGVYLWSNWSEYSQCTMTCGGGRQRRTRYCRGVGTNRRCPGSRFHIRSCGTNSCAAWGEWALFGDCNRSCGGGLQEERRTCENGTGCIGPNSRNEIQCNAQDCPPEWSQWSRVGECSVSCGGGIQEERRSCMNGTGCFGYNSRYLLSCNNSTCPGDIGPWSTWTDCSATCGQGHRIKQRKCGDDCIERTHEKCSAESDCKCNKPCNSCSDNSRYRFFCKRAGRLWCKLDFTANVCRKTCKRCSESCAGCEPAYLKWSSWGNCTVKCGGGFQLRFRTCNKQSGCTNGKYYESATCANQTCADASNSTWGPWLTTKNCSVMCGGGVKTEARVCRNGTDCKGFSSRQVLCNTGNCSTDAGTWEPWNANGTCSMTCGGGKRRETRNCLNGTICMGNNTREVVCNTQSCPTWGSWKPGSCSVTCGKGKQMDTRKCMNGPGCLGNKSRSVACSTQPCPFWGKWKDAGSCSTSCGPGTIPQTRTCINPPGCQGPSSREEKCNQGECESPVWGKWKKEGNCSLSCGGGTQHEVRICINGPGCAGNRSRQVPCNEHSCPAWGAWISEGECSSTCGGGSLRETRKCTNGPGCSGNHTRMVECSTQQCPTWGEWQSLGLCSRSCGGGRKNETRSCNNGSGCEGDSWKTIDCNTHSCVSTSESSSWKEWSQWSACPVTCGRGYRSRVRECDNGTACFGRSKEEETCTVDEVCPCQCPATSKCDNKFAAFCHGVPESFCSFSTYQEWCPTKCGSCGTCDPCGTWEPWKDISECSEVCGNGTITRERVCPVGKTCNGLSLDTFTCYLTSCEQPHWLTWEEWSHCSASCDGGEQKRRRNCSSSGTSRCGNSSSQIETRPCNVVACDAAWSNWSDWSKCSRYCGPGVQRRQRKCAGKQCVGSYRDEKACIRKPCSTVTNSWSSCSRSCGTGTRTRRMCRNGECKTEREDCGRTCAKATCALRYQRRYKSRDFECCHHKRASLFTCGISSPNEGRIINGEDSLLAQWPWMVLLRTTDNNLCGGTLITRYMVITAAHCVSGKSPKDISLRLGALKFDDNGFQVQARNVANIFIHPQFEFPLNDIAILQLETPAILGGKYVKTLCLPQNESVPDDTTCVAAGWGLTQPRNSWNSAVASTLQEVELRTLNFDLCQESYQDDDTVKDKMHPDSMVCAGKISGGVDTCNGDSGGPLMCQRCSSCAWFLHGLTSFGSVDCGEANRPGVYTKISYFSSFVNNAAERIQDSLPLATRRTDELNIADGNYSSCNI